LYLPSSFAFGETGSSNGQVPAFTSVIYELELYQIN
jgi:FKBP-type peptidyl-prolyl cis-trans isomerase